MKTVVILLMCMVLQLAAAAVPAPRASELRASPPDRIVNGVNTDIEDVPYQLALLQFGQLICGASILSQRIVLTAAHCTDGTPAVFLTVRAGSSYASRGGQTVRVLRKTEHADYDAKTTDNDVAILKLVFNIRLGTGAQPVPILGVGSELQVGTVATVSGWGALYTDGPSPQYLQSVQVPVVARSDCEGAYGPGVITGRMICFGLPEGGKDSCQGDSGGPLVTQGIQVGIVSFGGVCGAPGVPGVYTNIADPSINDFIKSASEA